MLGGVASGFGRYLDVDPVLVRIALLILAFANGLGLLLYLICWVIVPAKGAAPGASPSGTESAFAGKEPARDTPRSERRSGVFSPTN